MPPPRSPSRPRRHALAVAAVVAGAAALDVVAGAPSPAAAVPAPPAGWSLVWGDDFTGPAGARISDANWLYDIGTSYPGGAPNWGTGEVEYMTDSTQNVSVVNVNWFTFAR
jgi:hypothetical protein